MSLSRRDFLKITALAGAAVGISATAARHLLKTGALHKISETHHLMGTLVNFVVVAEDENLAHSAIKTTVDEMLRLIKLYDYRQADSPLGLLNATGLLNHPPLELVAMLRKALHFGTVSAGAFDITVKPLIDALRENRAVSSELIKSVDYRKLSVTEDKISLDTAGMAITLDGIAKGSVVDAGVALLEKLGFATVLVEAGGDMLARSSNIAQTWKIGITHPRLPNEFIAKVSIQNQAIATSGDYMNHFTADYSACHIIDPRTGHSPAELASATVIASSVTEADALSTTMMVLGVADGLALIESLPNTAALLVSKEMKLYRSSQFPEG